jgi:hypothetical protein
MLTWISQPPLVEIQLKESTFGLGLLYDSLTVDSGRRRDSSIPLILVFLETVLGYELQRDRGSAGSVWEFRRTRGFK